MKVIANWNDLRELIFRREPDTLPLDKLGIAVAAMESDFVLALNQQEIKPASSAFTLALTSGDSIRFPLLGLPNFAG